MQENLIITKSRLTHPSIIQPENLCKTKDKPEGVCCVLEDLKLNCSNRNSSSQNGKESNDITNLLQKLSELGIILVLARHLGQLYLQPTHPHVNLVCG